jgi:hypothetical protein
LGPPSRLSNGWREVDNFRGQDGRNVKLATHLHFDQRSRNMELYIHSFLRIYDVFMILFCTKILYLN